MFEFSVEQMRCWLGFQGGSVTAMAISQGVLLGFVPSGTQEVIDCTPTQIFQVLDYRMMLTSVGDHACVIWSDRKGVCE